MMMLRTVVALAAALIGMILMVPVLVLAIPFWLVSGLSRRVAARLAPRAVQWADLIDYEPDVGWRPRPDLDAVALDLNGDGFHVTTDSDGWRGTASIENADVIAFGDSFAFGSAVDDDQFFADAVDRPRIKAIGAPGYNLVQSYHWLTVLAPRLRGKLVVWLVYPGNDLDDNLLPNMDRYRMPFMREQDGAWEIVTSHVNQTPWPIPGKRRNIESYVDICCDTFRTSRTMGAFDDLLGRVASACEGAGADLLVVTIPDYSQVNRPGLLKALAMLDDPQRFDDGLPDRRIGEVCATRGIRFLPLAECLGPADYLTADVHWTADGNRKVAQAIARAWKEGPAPVSASGLAGMELAR
jgi:hypothetical protein